MKSATDHPKATDSAAQRDFNSKSTTVQAQRRTILAELRLGPRTSYALRRLGCYQAPTRIWELRRAGHNIKTLRITLYDRDGYFHSGVALYTLVGEPNGGKS